MNNIFKTAAYGILFYGATIVGAQDIIAAPKIVVGITIEQLSLEKLSELTSILSKNGLNKIVSNSQIYSNVDFDFTPIDRISAISAINTGTNPYYNGIIGNKWFDKKCHEIKSFINDINYLGINTLEQFSAESLLTSTISDELRFQSNGKSMVYSFALNAEDAIVYAGHNANGAYWINSQNKEWCTSSYYNKTLPEWVEKHNKKHNKEDRKADFNTRITNFAIDCIKEKNLGSDNNTDLIYIYYKPQDKTRLTTNDYKKYLIQTDANIERLLDSLCERIDISNILFIITGTMEGNDNQTSKSDKIRYPGGTFHTDRATNLLNMYLGAKYGTDKYIDGYYSNQIYFNDKIQDRKNLTNQDITYQSKIFLRQLQGVSNIMSGDEMLSHGLMENKVRNGYNSKASGDLIIELTPGWKISDEDTREAVDLQKNIGASILLYGYDLKPNKVTSFTPADRITATIAKIINIRAPNACKAMPLFQ